MHDVLIVADSIRKKYTTQRTLRNGVSVVFRPIECTDASKYREFFKSLSPSSIHYRFLETIKELPNETVERYCHLDYSKEIAIVAESQDGRIVAVARLEVDSKVRRGEFALVVADAWQGVGLGAELLGYLIEVALDYGLLELHCFVSGDNLRMIRLAQKMGFKARSVDGDTIKMVFRLDGSDRTPIA